MAWDPVIIFDRSTTNPKNCCSSRVHVPLIILRPILFNTLIEPTGYIKLRSVTLDLGSILRSPR